MKLKNIYTPELSKIDLGYYPAWNSYHKKYGFSLWAMDDERCALVSIADGDDPLHDAMVGAVVDFATYATNADDPDLHSSTAELSIIHDYYHDDITNTVLGVDVYLAVCGGDEDNNIVMRCDLAEMISELIEICKSDDFDEHEKAEIVSRLDRFSDSLRKESENLDLFLKDQRKGGMSYRDFMSSSDLGPLSLRTRHCLYYEGITTVERLKKYDDKMLLDTPNIGKSTLLEIKEFLSK